ncbi:MAG: peptidoglycan DD-metalloendopeptidase family protein [Phormidesmis sp.]
MDSSHSRFPEGNESNITSSNLKSAAMLGIALSVGASGALVSQADASAAVSVPTTSSATTEAFSNNSKASASTSRAEQSQAVVALHTVESGESLWQIAQQHRVGLHDLKLANALPPEASIAVGQVLKVPGAATADTLIEGATTPAQLVASVATGEKAAGILAPSERQNDLQNSSQSEGLQTESLQVESLQTESQRAGLAANGSILIAETVETEAAPTTSAASLQIEIAQAAPQQTLQPENAPVMTALATSTSPSSYQVQVGDTLSSIASSLGTTSAELMRANRLTNPNVIFAGSVLRVPGEVSDEMRSPIAEPNQELAKKVEAPQADTRNQQPELTDSQIAHLRNTATRPENATLIENLREASPEQAISVGGETITEQDVLTANLAGDAESVDPYVANLLEEVQAIRAQSVQTFEADSTEVAAELESDETIATAAEASSPLLASTASAVRPSPTAQVAQINETPATSANSDLLAAAPLSPEAYIPAQRSSAAGQVVSPDMPILPSADEYLPEAPNHFDGYIWPTNGTVTSGYGWRWGRMHRGVDVAGPVGTTVVAAASGVVEQAGWNSGGYGNMVEIRHADGSLTRYAHNNRLNVSSGQTVSQGQKIAEMGSTGYSTGPHLHFEVHQNGGTVNPVAYLPGR